jgi:WD40 repeat protein
VRNRIYEGAFDGQWVTQHMPDAELRRQRTAYRRGLVRATSVATVILALMGVLAAVAVDQAREARRQQERWRRDSPDGRTLASAGKDLKVRLWKLAPTGDPRKPVTLQGEPALLTGCTAKIRMLAFTPDGSVLAAAGYENAIRLWDVSTRRAMGDPLPLSKNSVVTGPGLAFSANGLLAARDGPSLIRLWDSTRRWRTLPTIQSPGEFESNPALAFSPDGEILAYTAGKTVRIRRLADRRETTLRGPSAESSGVAFSPDGRTVATTGADETIGLWDTITGLWRTSLKGHSSDAIRVAFARDGNRGKRRLGHHDPALGCPDGPAAALAHGT